MQKNELQKYNLPDVPGVYFFKQGRKVLYVGKATSLRDRVRSYFDDALIHARGARVVDMVTRADKIAYETTPTVLEALVREAALIKRHHPVANTDGKDDSTFLYAVITDEEIPRVLTPRGKDIDFKMKKLKDQKLKSIFGPFPSGVQLREGLRLIRRIFPFFDTQKPLNFAWGRPVANGKQQQAQLEFNTQIRQYPRLPAQSGTFDAAEYRRTMRHIALFLGGKATELRKVLAQEMKQSAKRERFEDAARARRQLFALDHIQDVSLIKDENQVSLSTAGRPEIGIRVEAYDTAHLSGTNALGVMVVVEGGTPVKKEYRTFKIRGLKKNDDIASLQEILSRRLNHPEWQLPKVIVVDGGMVHKKAAEKVLSDAGVGIPVVAVVKNERHRPREIIGARRVSVSEPDIVLANAEAHRFALSRHRRARNVV